MSQSDRSPNVTDGQKIRWTATPANRMSDAEVARFLAEPRVEGPWVSWRLRSVPGCLLDAPVDSAEAGWRPVYARGLTQVSDQARHALDP
jgi:hypothetical protein